MISQADRLDIAASPAKTLLLGLGALVFAAAGLWLVRSAPAEAFAQFIGWIGMLFFGFCALGIAWRGATLKGPVVTMDRDQITDRRVSDHPIPWSAVLAISTWAHQGQKVMILRLDPTFETSFPTKAITRMTRGMNAKLGADGIAIAASGLKIGYDEMLAAAIRFRTQAETR